MQDIGEGIVKLSPSSAPIGGGAPIIARRCFCISKSDRASRISFMLCEGEIQIREGEIIFREDVFEKREGVWGVLLSVYIMVYMHFLLVLLQTEGLPEISATRATRDVTS